MRTHEPNGQKKRFVQVLVAVNQLDRLLGGLAVGVDQVVTLRLHHHEAVASGQLLRAVGIVLQGFPFTRSPGLGAAAVEFLVPGSGVVGTVASLGNIGWHPHVKHLRDPGTVITVPAEVLRPTVLVGTNLLASAGIAVCLGGIGIIPKQERRPRGPAKSGLAIGPGETGALGGQRVYVGSPADPVTVTTQGRRGEVVRDDEKDVELFCLHRPRQGQQRGEQDEGRRDSYFRQSFFFPA